MTQMTNGENPGCDFGRRASKLPRSFQANMEAGTNRNIYSQNLDVWKEAPILTGTTKFEPKKDVKNIMVTGGAGFM